MGMIRRLLNIGVGLAAGAFAYKLLDDFNKTKMVEGEFTVIDHKDENAAPEKAEEEAEPEQPAPEAGKESSMPLGGAAPLARDENGHVDPAAIADPEDFKDWDDMGCKG